MANFDITQQYMHLGQIYFFLVTVLVDILTRPMTGSWEPCDEISWYRNMCI